MSACDLVGFLASGLVFLSFCMTSMTWLRIVGRRNIALNTYALHADLRPVLLLHAALLTMNARERALRLLQVIKGDTPGSPVE